MKHFFSALIAGLVAVLLGVAKHFKAKAERLEAANIERDAKDREAVARMEERRAAIVREYLERKPVDPKNRVDFE
jgi:phosphoserine phosphatase